MTFFGVILEKLQNSILLPCCCDSFTFSSVIFIYSTISNFLHFLLSLSLSEHLSPTESDGDMLGYDLYSSALADILSEPTMQPPICVGLYAQWGSGKSFLLKKLEGR